LNPRPLGYEQAARRPSTFSLSLDIALDLSRSRGEVSTSLTCAVPSHAVLVTAMVTTPSAITPGKALRLACLTRFTRATQAPPAWQGRTRIRLPVAWLAAEAH
jgi:hypothetical protein